MRSFCIAALLVSSALSQPVVHYATKLGGSGHDSVAGIAIDRDGNTWIAGTTSSLDFPVTGAKQPKPAGSSFFRAEGDSFTWSYDTSVVNPYTLAASASVPDLVYTADAKGVHKSTDGGDTWSLLPNQPPIRFVAAIAIDPHNADILYAGGDEGIFKSTDAGGAWTKIGDNIQPKPLGVPRTIEVDPFDSRHIIALIGSSLCNSNDGGATWSVPVLPASSFAFDRGRPGFVFATSFGLLKSTDYGQHWSNVASSTFPSAPIVFPDPLHPGVLYASSSQFTFQSVDDGATWKFLFTSSYYPFLASDPVSKKLYVSLGTHLAKSADGFAHVEDFGPPAVPFIRIFAAGAGSGGPGTLRIYAITEVSTDLFVAKLDKEGKVLYSSYLGGSSGETATALALDASGNVYVTGLTASMDFPVTKGAYQTTFPGTPTPGLQSLPFSAGFLTKLDPEGKTIYSTYFAGRRTTPKALAVDAAGSVYMTGVTSGDLPVTPGVYQSTILPACGLIPCINISNGIAPTFQALAKNAFVARFNPAGSALVFSTYLGDTAEEGSAIAVDSAGVAYLAGKSLIYEMNAMGTQLITSTTLGPASITAITLDQSGNIVVAGSALDSFYTTPGAFQKKARPLVPLPGGYPGYGTGDAFITKLNPALSILYSSQFGGEGADSVSGIAIDPTGVVTVAGVTGSRSFPLAGASQSLYNTHTGFVSRLSADASALVYSTYVGDRSVFSPVGVAVDAAGNAVFAGYTATPGSLLNEGPAFPTDSDDVWVTRLDQSAPPPLVVDSVVNTASQFGGAIAPLETVTVRGSGFGPGAVVLIDGIPLTPLSQTANEMLVVIPQAYQFRPGADARIQAFFPADARVSNTFLVPVALTAPGLYSADGSSVGQGYILHEDGTRNSPNNPIAEGSIITIFATGVGLTTHIAQSDITTQTVSVSIDGFYASGVDAHVGPVPGLPGDVFQLKVIVPRPADWVDINPNLKNFKMPPTVPVALTIGGVSSQAGLTLSVK